MKKKTVKKRTPAKRPAKTPPRKPRTPSAALVRATQAIQDANAAALVPAKDAEPETGMMLRDDAYLANFGVDPPVFTTEQEAILSAPIPELEVQILPTGQPYLPHMAYALWLDKAFGRTGWVLRPMANPRRIEEPSEKGPRIFLQQPFGLYIGGKMAAWAYGVAEYHESNRDQNYGDVLEALQSFGLRRCCKHLRVGHELWNKAWLHAWREKHCVQVRVVWRNGKTFPQWRRRLDPPLPDEAGLWTGSTGDQERQDAGEPRRFAPSTSPEPISEKQLGRLIAIAKGRGVTDAQLKAWLEVNLPYTKRQDGVVSKTRIQKKDYERVCTAVEAGLQSNKSETWDAVRQASLAQEPPPTTVMADEIDWDPRFTDAGDRGPRW